MRKLIEAASNNEDVDVLPWYLGVKFTVQYDNTSLPIGRSVPISETSHGSVQVILE